MLAIAAGKGRTQFLGWKEEDGQFLKVIYKLLS
jgi:hypothetical protein